MMKLDELVDQLKKVYGAQLQAVVLYGSAAAGEHIAKRSDYNVLVIVDELTMDHMRAGAAVARAWGEGGNPPPLTLTSSEWRGSADIFPMEYADILERHRVLFGAPPFDGISVDRRHLLRDVSNVIAQEEAHVVSIRSEAGRHGRVRLPGSGAYHRPCQPD